MDSREQSLRVLLNNIAAEQGYVDYELIVDGFSSGGANYTSKLYTAVIRSPDKEDLNLFAKITIVGDKIREGIGSRMFDTESFVYNKLAKIYKDIEEENGLAEEHRLTFPKYYGCDATKYQETIVLENLVAAGYSSYDRFKSVEWDYAKATVTQMARLHALSFAYSERDPEEFKLVLAELRAEMKEGSLDVMAEGSIKNALKHVDNRHKKQLARFYESSMTEIVIKTTPPSFRPVIVHGDFRGSNIMHKVDETGKVDIKIVDLQTLQGGSPVTDLLYFIFTGSDEQFRAQYYEKLIDHYYQELSAALKRLHLNPDQIYSRQNFDEELKEKLPFGLALAVFTLPVITVDTDKAPKVNESMEITDFSVSNTSELYKERLNGVINDYVRWGVLK
ncbi:uncharacterized protein LOC113502052 isoform X2 [Trichoplusia ni]|uniref:Uncharacterized protein LOC113502052 isoform X2 n=1 Tax=Trichoplusia ni TaxID=7111 RepID=A0A7E5WFP4_TRINI|nr:uncharacterized protein LOC113502052 isoform X2 [Trichoplusia ni]